MTILEDQHFVEGAVDENFASLRVGLRAEWRLNGDGTDSSDNTNTQTITNATLTTDQNGDADKAYDFNNSNRYGTAADHPTLAPDTGLTLVAYKRLVGYTGGSSSGLPCDISRWPGLCWFLGMEDAIGADQGKVRFRMDAVELKSASPLALGVWCRIVARYNGTQLKLSINEVAETPVARVGSIPTTASDVHIGILNLANKANSMPGDLSYVGMWGRELTDDEVNNTLPSYLIDNS